MAAVPAAVRCHLPTRSPEISMAHRGRMYAIGAYMLQRLRLLRKLWVVGPSYDIVSRQRLGGPHQRLPESKCCAP